MKLLRPENKNKNTKLIGAVVAPHVHQYLTLFALAKGSTKSKLLKTLLDEWMLAHRNTETDDQLLRELVQRIKDQWEREKELNPAIKFDKFEAAIQNEMRDRGLKMSYITMVLNGLH